MTNIVLNALLIGTLTSNSFTGSIITADPLVIRTNLVTVTQTNFAPPVTITLTNFAAAVTVTNRFTINTNGVFGSGSLIRIP